MTFTHPSCNIRKLLLYFGFLLGLVCVFLFCFYHLSYDELKSFDEARHGVSAYEMLQTGEPIVTTYAYSPDYWNLKPPLSEWLIALGYKLFGYNALGIRFYSAFSIFLAALLCALYLWKRHNALASIFVFSCFRPLVVFFPITVPVLQTQILYSFCSMLPLFFACAKAATCSAGYTLLVCALLLHFSRKAFMLALLPFLFYVRFFALGTSTPCV